jgi:hypothetical protein
MTNGHQTNPLIMTQEVILRFNFIEPSIDQLYSEKDYPFIRA